MPQDTGELLVAFRTVYQQFEQAVKEVLLDLADPTVIAQLGDGLDEYATLAIDVSQSHFIIYPFESFCCRMAAFSNPMSWIDCV